MMLRLFANLPLLGDRLSQGFTGQTRGHWWLRPYLWFFLRPSRWQAYLRRRVGLASGQPLLALAQWRQKSLLLLLLRGLILVPAALGILLTFIYWGAGWGSGSPFFGISLSLFLGFVFALFVSLEAGMMVSIGYTILLLPITFVETRLTFDLVLSNSLGWLTGCTAAVACATAVQVQPGNSRYTFARQAGGMIIGLALSSVVFWLALETTNQVVFYWRSGYLTSISTSLVVGIVPALILTIAAAVRSGSLLRGGLAGFGIGICLTLLTFAFLREAAFETHIVGSTFKNLNLVIVTAVFLFLFILPFTMANWLGGIWAGVVAGGFSTLAFHVAYGEIYSFYPALENLTVALALMIAGLTLIWWRPLLTYPVQLAWNTIVFRFAEVQPEKSLRWLLWHAVSWDEGQFLPLTDLPDFMLYLIEHNPEARSELLDTVSQTPQNWAASQVQIELDAQFLGQITQIAEISGVHAQITIGLADSPTASLMEQFKFVSQDVAAGLDQHSRYNKRLGLRAAASRLNNLINDLTRSDEKFALRFRPIALKWGQLVNAEIQRLEARAKDKQEIDDPYIIGIPLAAQQETFVGRVGVSRKIETLLLDKRRPPLLIYGQRRMGKTSLLNNLGRLLPRSFIPLFVDLQGPVSFAANHAGLLFNLARSLQRSAYQYREVTLPNLARTAVTSDPFTAFDLWLDEVEKILLTENNNQIVLMLDEFEALDEAFTTGRFAENLILGMLRHIIQNRTRIKVLLAGSHTLAEFKRWSAYLLNAEVIHLSCLTAAESHQLIEQPIPNFGLRYAPEMAAYVYQLTAGHPFLLQLLCSEIIAIKNNQSLSDRWLVTRRDIEGAISPALKRGTLFFADIERNQLDLSGAQLLSLLARQGGKKRLTEAEVTAVSFQADQDIAAALNNFVLRELMVKQPSGYQFKIELVRRWFADFR